MVMMVSMTGELVVTISKGNLEAITENGHLNELNASEAKQEEIDPEAGGSITHNSDRRNFTSSERPIKSSGLLPEVTSDVLRQHAEEQNNAAAKLGMTKPNGVGGATSLAGSRNLARAVSMSEEPASICGIPYWLFMILTALVAAVTAGTVMAVIYYDPNSDLQPPGYPTEAPTFLTPLPTTADATNSTTTGI